MQERRKKEFNLEAVIADARNALNQNSHDVAHGVEHHQNVANNVDYIIGNEGIKGGINYEALKVAAWWHDYDRHSGNYSVMTKSLEENGATPEFIKKVIDTIHDHSDLKNQKKLSREQMILKLADKIEYCDLDRYKDSLKGMKGLELIASQTYWRLRIKKVIKMMDKTEYKSAKELFNKKFKELYYYVKADKPEDLRWFKGLV